MTDLLQLAARVEALSGANREVDAEIARVAGPAKEQQDGTWITYFDGGYSHSMYPPKFTGSLDAAMTLVDIAADIYLRENYAKVRCYPNEDEDVSAVARSHPIAVCAAALKALAARAQEPTHD